jgi:hypothetical protein
VFGPIEEEKQEKVAWLRASVERRAVERRICVNDWESAEGGLRYGRPKAVDIITYSDRLDDPFVFRINVS